MKGTDINLTIQEAEELCRLYAECKLSVLEERELEYLLSHMPESTPELDRTRALMGIAARAESAARLSPKSAPRRFLRPTLMAVASIAAVVVLALGIFFGIGTRSAQYEAFADGRTLDLEAARLQASQQSKNADEIIDMMDMMILERQNQYENFKRNLALYP